MCPPNPVAREVGVGVSRCWGQGRFGRQLQGCPSTVAGGKKGPRAGWLNFADLMALCCFRFSGGEGATLERGVGVVGVRRIVLTTDDVPGMFQ